jgi:catechol 2,3-dioxygenase-like lactoylglutathione lyase family enzyme
MRLDTIDLIVRDVPATAAFFRDILGLTVNMDGERFAEIEASPLKIQLSPDAMVPTGPARGVILHFRVDDVRQTLEQARARGASILLEYTQTDWGWESAMIAGPEDIVIDIYRPIEA